VRLPTDPGRREWEPLDRKVISISEDDGTCTALVRLAGIGRETRERIVERWAFSRRDKLACTNAGTIG
jgi:hypothetical protein